MHKYSILSRKQNDIKISDISWIINHNKVNITELEDEIALSGLVLSC